MRRWMICSLLAAAWATPVLAGEKKKPEAPTIQVIVLREGEAQVLPPGGGGVVVVPGQIPPPAGARGGRSARRLTRRDDAARADRHARPSDLLGTCYKCRHCRAGHPRER